MSRDVIYLHGFASSPASHKAQFFRRRFEERGCGVSVPDLAEGDFEHLTITGQLKVIEGAHRGRPITLVGSSMGGYLAALYAARHPGVDRLILLAPAFCLARRWPDLLGEEAMRSWRETGWRAVFHYGDDCERRLWYRFLTDGLQYEDYPQVQQPALILHGERDDVVPLAFSEQFKALRPYAKLVPLRSGHELTDVTDRLWEETALFLGL